MCKLSEHRDLLGFCSAELTLTTRHFAIFDFGALTLNYIVFVVS